jgi:quinol monooxygenase YgiN
MIIVVANVTIQPVHRETFVAGAKACIAETRKEAGCHVYDMHQSVTNPDHYVFVERWESQAVMDAHMKTPHLQAFLALATPCLAAAPTIEAIPADNITRVM